MAAVPPGALRRQFAGTTRRAAAGSLQGCGLVPRREMDVLRRRLRRKVSHLAPAIGWRHSGADYLRPERGGRNRARAGRPVPDYLGGPTAKRDMVSRSGWRAASVIPGLRRLPFSFG